MSAKDGRIPRRTSPVARPPPDFNASSSKADWRSSAFTWGSICSPNSVSTSPRPVRWKRRPAQSRSSPAMVRLTAGCTVSKSTAALVRLPSSATWTKTRNASRSNGSPLPRRNDFSITALPSRHLPYRGRLGNNGQSEVAAAFGEMSMSDIVVEQTGQVISVTLDAPPVNALTLDRYRRLGEVFDEISRRDDVHCVVFTAKGTKAFCAGLDLNEFLAATPDQD